MSDLEIMDMDPVDTRPVSSVGESLADRIRRRHLGKTRTKDLAVPRWEGDIVVRFKVLPTSEVVRVGKGKKTPLVCNADLLVAACKEVFLLDEEDGTLHPMSEADGGAGPVRFDGRLADIMGLKGDTPRAIAIQLYAEDTALHGHASALMAWMTGQDLDVLEVEEIEDTAGEVLAAT